MGNKTKSRSGPADFTGVEIEKGHPIPLGSNVPASSLAAKMQHGDSVLVETRNKAEVMRSHLTRRGFKTATREENGKWRVWAVKVDVPDKEHAEE